MTKTWWRYDRGGVEAKLLIKLSRQWHYWCSQNFAIHSPSHSRPFAFLPHQLDWNHLHCSCTTFFFFFPLCAFLVGNFFVLYPCSSCYVTLHGSNKEQKIIAWMHGWVCFSPLTSLQKQRKKFRSQKEFCGEFLKLFFMSTFKSQSWSSVSIFPLFLNGFSFPWHHSSVLKILTFPFAYSSTKKLSNLMDRKKGNGKVERYFYCALMKTF